MTGSNATWASSTVTNSNTSDRSHRFWALAWIDCTAVSTERSNCTGGHQAIYRRPLSRILTAVRPYPNWSQRQSVPSCQDRSPDRLVRRSLVVFSGGEYWRGDSGRGWTYFGINKSYIYTENKVLMETFHMRVPHRHPASCTGYPVIGSLRWLCLCAVEADDLNQLEEEFTGIK